MSLKALSDYTIYAKYAQYNHDAKRRETWEEMVDRVFAMHSERYSAALAANPEFVSEFEFAKLQVKKKRVLGSQRALQFGGAPIFKHNARLYNCAFTHADRTTVFQEIVYLLLAGCGVGFSVQKHHVHNLPSIASRTNGPKTFTPDDSIEGWSDCVGALISSYFTSGTPFPDYQGHEVEFDLTPIRPAGNLVANQFKAPGPRPLAKGLNRIKQVIENRLTSPDFHTGEFAGKLRPIDVYDVIMHSSDMILSGGIRRSATISLFSKDDQEMMKAKTGNWYTDNPQRGRSNNSVVLLRGKTTKEEFEEIMHSTKEFGEPGFVWTDDTEIGYNPCVEIGLYPKTEDGRSGFQFCNLTEINGRYCDTEEKFLQLCRAASIIGTLQAGYCDFKYLSQETTEITKREALLGCSITGVMDNPDVILDKRIQRKGAEAIKEMNRKIAGYIGVNPAARCTAVKPAGSTSCVLSTSSGIHPHHARRYIRRVQANTMEFPVQHYKEINPGAVEESVWSTNNTDEIISFLCEVPKGAIIKNDLSAVDLLKRVMLTQQNWVEAGTNKELCVNPVVRHNVSNTITVKEDEWDQITDFIYKHREWFAGISLLPASGDLDYPQAPFSTVLNPREITETYGDAAVFASGLIVDGLKAFEDNLWAACDVVLGRGESVLTPQEVVSLDQEYNAIFLKPVNVEEADRGAEIREQLEGMREKSDWIRRANQFADRYFSGDRKQMTYCLKHVSLWKTWCDLKREHKDIDWSTVVEETQTAAGVDTLGAQACSGGKCEL